MLENRTARLIQHLCFKVSTVYTHSTCHPETGHRPHRTPDSHHGTPQEPKDAVEVDLDDMDIEEAAAFRPLLHDLVMIFACGLIVSYGFLWCVLTCFAHH